MSLGIGTILGGLLGVGGAIQSSQQQKRANDLSAQALAQTKNEYDSRNPFRQLALQQLGNIEAPKNLGNLSYNPTNPFAVLRGPQSSNAFLTGTQNNTFQAPSPAASGPPTSGAGSATQQGLLLDMLSHAPNTGLKKQLQQQLSALGSTPIPLGSLPQQPQTTYGWTGK